MLTSLLEKIVCAPTNRPVEEIELKHMEKFLDALSEAVAQTLGAVTQAVTSLRKFPDTTTTKAITPKMTMSRSEDSEMATTRPMGMPPGLSIAQVRERWPGALDALPPDVGRLSVDQDDGGLWAGRDDTEATWQDDEKRWSLFRGIRGIR